MAFEDLLDSSKYEVPVKARPSITINGVNLRVYGFELTGLPDILLPPTRQRTTTLTGRHGQLSFGDLYENWNFSIDGQIVGQNLEDVVQKQHKLLRFLDIERDQDFAIGEQNYTGLRFELSGAPLFADKGTVNVTSNQKSVTGVGTLFTAYAKPGATFEVAGDSTIYTIESVPSDTSIIVNPSITRATGSSLSYRVERRRYLLVSYDGSSSISPIADRGFNKQGGVGDIVRLGYNFTFGFYTVYPYWVGDTFTKTFSSLSNNTINTLEYVGNAPSNPVYFITGHSGTTDNPSITAGKTAFNSNYDGQTKASETKNQSLVAPSLLDNSKAAGTQSDMKFAPLTTTTKFGVNGSTDDAFYLKYENLSVNQDEFSVFLEFDYAAGAIDLISFNTTASSQTSKKIELKIDGSNQLSVSNENGDIIAASSDTVITEGYHTLSYWVNKNGSVDSKDSNTYYSKILLDGEIIGTTSSSFIHNITALYDHLFLAIRRSTIGCLHVFNYSLTDEELRELHFSKLAKNNNNTLNYNAALASGDIVRYNSKDTSSELYDSSLGAKINCYSTFSGNAPYLYGGDNEKENIYVTTNSSTTIEQLNITYQPHFR